MAKYSIKFKDKTDFEKSIEVFSNDNDSILIYVEDEGLSILELDISTAIKLAKTLRTEINKAKEVQNG